MSQNTPSWTFDHPVPGVSARIDDSGMNLLDVEFGDSKAVVAQQGAHLMKWSIKGQDVLFLADAKRVRGVAIRGGVPVSFPWFGPRRADFPEGSDLSPNHGFARISLWHLRSVKVDPVRGALVTLEFKSTPDTKRFWRVDFSITLEIVIGKTLQMRLMTTNTSTGTICFEAAFHTYFGVSDVTNIQLTGLAGVKCFDKNLGKEYMESRDPMTFDGVCDRIYTGSSDTCTIIDPGLGRRVINRKFGSRSTVVWHPWTEPGRSPNQSDITFEESRRFLCVETGNITDDWTAIAPGETNEIGLEVEVQPI